MSVGMVLGVEAWTGKCLTQFTFCRAKGAADLQLARAAKSKLSPAATLPRSTICEHKASTFGRPATCAIVADRGVSAAGHERERQANAWDGFAHGGSACPVVVRLPDRPDHLCILRRQERQFRRAPVWGGRRGRARERYRQAHKRGRSPH